jgi:hypothetical protein
MVIPDHNITLPLAIHSRQSIRRFEIAHPNTLPAFP